MLFLEPTFLPANRFLHQTIQNHLLAPKLLPALLLAIRTTVFPSNSKRLATGRSVIPSSDAEVGNLAIPTSTPHHTVPPEQNESLPPPPLSATPPVEASGKSATTKTSASPPQDPSDLQPARTSAQITSIKRACATSLLELIPRRIALAIFCIPSDAKLDNDATTPATSPPDDSGLSARLDANNPAAPDKRGASSPAAPSARVSVPTIPSALSTTKAEHGPDSDNSSGSATCHNSDSAFVQSNPETSYGRGSEAGQSAQGETDEVGKKAAERRAETATATETATEENENESGDQLLLSAIEHDLLDLFADSYCNKHLLYSIVETVLVRLVPEMAQQGIAELMAERGL